MGKIVEEATVDDLFYDTKHPYTRALLRSLPLIGHKRRLTPIGGSVPNPYLLPEGCLFEPRCSFGSEACTERAPELIKIGDEHFVSCCRYR
jgi:oligopeptide/dipeptide ABC transporter ATP-binding protein